MSARFFNRLGATQLYRRALCGGVRSEAWSGTYGAVPGCPPELAEAAKLNLVWGNNATVTNLHLVRCIRKSKRAGGRLVVVDPLRTKIAAQADLHLQLLPGTDVVLAWSLAAELERSGALDTAFVAAHILGAEDFMARARQWPAARAAAVCGLTENEILTLVRWLADIEPLVLSPDNGLVDITCAMLESECELCINDCGCGMPAGGREPRTDRRRRAHLPRRRAPP